MTTYFNVPTTGATTAARAYKIACTRWEVQYGENREQNAGICFNGDHGQTAYVDWADLPAPRRYSKCGA